MSKISDVISTAIAMSLAVAMIIVLAGAIISIPVYFLWNWVAVAMGAPSITFMQAWGLFALCHILFNGARCSKSD